ncbi:glycosyltransferase family 2 protein [Scandinavium goeteborgense]|uniref:glycosyltransferase family 2 protein n=1 Tax=Scandinavium goeteborgense TaxID=1851514 RepID=UPI000F68E9F3|nr:glycosyltransferase family 2 protein [Scandinavium goeteborgense]QKN79780.1 NTP transferase domain-containing protein [Scandinavium goeteborgense]
MLNIVIPMAGRGSRFSQAGFTDPKPFIPVEGIPMIELVINNLRPEMPHRFIFVCQQAHLVRYDFQRRLSLLAPGSKIIALSDVTAGAACTVLAAADFIDNDEPLMIANSDQWVDVDINDYLAEMNASDLDGLIMTMKSSDPKWSYAQSNAEGWVHRVVEKQVVSDEATVGIYNFRRGSDFCRLARAMITRNDRSQGEFYVAPVYTDLCREGKYRIGVYNIGRDGMGMHGLGTPKDLSVFLESSVLTSALLTSRGAA